ncbi:PEP-CTERM sorting domain-containing protein [Paucibacter sp. M5-1]|uniref:PEP-CTERM sorting domain-containing protein n=1 Tax=Paucibacter sp. M5-1 TaxID=3015998 RepID=UPI0022B8CF0E|nr:PEP-CTERM sorting domain-containing protein [Paucibacter sp. M5-1]MCZ7880890.1 PEP-CTERM sorting domain-containing protein [Paucibacter sp. M5-1]
MRIRLKCLTAIACASLAANSHAVGIAGQGTWENTLQARDLDGNSANGPEAFYDTTLNITWLRSGSEHEMNWSAAKSWAEQSHFGIGGWRLPTMTDTNAPGCDYLRTGGTDCGYNVQTKSGVLDKYESDQIVYSEIAHLFHVTLGNKSFYEPGSGSSSQPGWDLRNTGDFQNLRSTNWIGVANAAEPWRRWAFNLFSGEQLTSNSGNSGYGLAVYAGDVRPAVPEPHTYALMLSGLALLAGLTRRFSNLRK